MVYTKIFLKSLGWVGSGRLVYRVFNFFKIFVLARILSPNDFGVFGVIVIVLALVDTLTDLGIHTLLVQEKNKKFEEMLDSSWTISILRGFVIGIILLMISPFLTIFFDLNNSSYFYVASLIPIAKGFINPRVTRLQAELKFKNEFFLRTLVVVSEIFIAILLGLYFKNAYALIFSILFSCIIDVFLSFLFFKPWPRFKINKAQFISIQRQGVWFTLSNLFNYFFQYLDNIAVGRFLGTYSLGLYDLGYKLAVTPTTEVTESISKITLPIFVKVKEDKKRLLRIFIKSEIVILTSVLIYGSILLVFSEEIIILLLGKDWIEIEKFIDVLIIFSIFRSIFGYSLTLFVAIKMQKYTSYINFISFIVVAITIIPLVNKFGLFGASISPLIATIATIPLIFYFLYRIFRH